MIESMDIESTGTEVVIDMPGTITAGLYDTPQQRWTVVTHAHRGQPAFLYQFAAPTDFWFQTLDDQLTSLTIDDEDSFVIPIVNAPEARALSRTRLMSSPSPDCDTPMTNACFRLSFA